MRETAGWGLNTPLAESTGAWPRSKQACLEPCWADSSRSGARVPLCRQRRSRIDLLLSPAAAAG